MSTKSIGFLAVIIVGLLVVACGNEKKKPHDEVAYKTMVVGKKDMTLERQYSGRMTGRQIVEVRPQVSGTITRICINEGETVKKGQTLFVIDQVPFQAALDVAVAARKSAEARLATARMNYNNERLLQEGHVVG
jgi:membrane fusion protein (multidrug efflux system)